MRQVVDGGGEDVYFQKRPDEEADPQLVYQTADLPLDMNPSSGKNTADVISIKMGVVAKPTEEDMQVAKREPSDSDSSSEDQQEQILVYNFDEYTSVLQKQHTICPIPTTSSVQPSLIPSLKDTRNVIEGIYN